MKRLVLIRHAKSSWDHDVSDKERPLANRGIRDIQRVSEEFRKNYEVPEIVFSSPAKRALETCKLFLNLTDVSYKNIGISSKLYDFSGHNLINFVRSLDNNHENVLIFGHNHAMTHFVNTYGNLYIDNLPTSGLAVFEFDIDFWNDLKPGKTIDIITPKSLKS